MSEVLDDPFQMDEELPSYKENDSVHKDITPRYDDNEMMNDPSIMNSDKRYIRSKLDQLKINEESTNNTGDDEPTYEEDIDDKFDGSFEPKETQESGDFADEIPQLTPPENFAPVINKIYRSSFPQPSNFPFVKKLKLKSILCLIPEDYPEEHEQFLEKENIKLFQLGMSGNKEPFVKISHNLITEAIKIVLNPANQPILIHCNRGKHRTGCLVGVLRRLQKWSLTIIFDEYRKFAAPKERPMDQQFIELYNEVELEEYAKENSLLPIPWD